MGHRILEYGSVRTYSRLHFNSSSHLLFACSALKSNIAAQTGVRRGIGFYETIVKSQVVRKGHGLFSLNRCKSTSKMSHISYVSKLLTLVKTLEPDERLRFKRPK